MCNGKNDISNGACCMLYSYSLNIYVEQVVASGSEKKESCLLKELKQREVTVKDCATFWSEGFRSKLCTCKDCMVSGCTLFFCLMLMSRQVLCKDLNHYIEVS